MKNLPNTAIPIVDGQGRPTSPMQGLVPGVAAQDVIVDTQGRATALFLARLKASAVTPLPNAAVSLVNPDGTPTRVMTAILMGLP